MEAKQQNAIMMKDEMDFFAMIERKLEQQGFEVLETLPPDRNTGNRSKPVFAYKSFKRFAY